MHGNSNRRGLVLITGATGYVGGHLIHKLRKKKRKLRYMARRPEMLRETVGKSADIVAGDLLKKDSLNAAMEGVDTAYYLVHSMASGGDFEKKDRLAAKNFASAASGAGVKKIIYLGGLARGEDLSSHLASRIEVGEILRTGGVPTVEFRASIIIGQGSLSFEMVRALVNRLPIMTAPKWVTTEAQPIYIGDVVSYLAAALDINLDGSRVFEIGGADRVSYLDIMKEYARASGQRRFILPVPVLSPWLSSLWLGLVTPLHAQVGRKLIEGVRNASVVEDKSALEVFDIKPRGISESIQLALGGLYNI